MTDAFATLAADPALYPMTLDAARGALLFVGMDEDSYRASSFLDDRAAPRDGRGQWAAIAQVERALSGPRDVRPLHFIFHAGHVGSTLLSRLLDETGKVLPLREPLPLRDIAERRDAAMPGADAQLELLLRLWERGFARTEAVILKATSSAQRLAVPLLSMRPRTKAVMLNVSAETYLATMLAGENSAADLNAHGPERLHRLGGLLGETPARPTTLGELAAMSWLAERLTQSVAVRATGGRILLVDFDRMLQALPETLARVLAHFSIACAPERIAALAGSAVLSRYSKAPEHAYSPSLRRDVLDQARNAFAPEIRDALCWLEKLAAKHHVQSAML